MNELLLDEKFDTSTFDSRLQWFNIPQKWGIKDSGLVIEPDAQTDYWQRTHYGFQVDNGHFLYAEVSGDFIATTRVRFSPVHQYDQAGLMVRISPACWLKTSVEYEPEEPNRLGVVVTNGGYSDWSTQSFPKACTDLMLRVRREDSDYLVDYAVNDLPDQEESTPSWTQIRMAHLHEDDGHIAVQCGLYACSPTESGYSAEFDFLTITPGRILSH
ncbi:DUF1349 domain-containing protein [candidate division KSB3 bacterium]|uniref:DUF1349 domain-containing protein n=1 Tax=candidate division KSB3 bacterium TaxID=2044937 RepID=A0A9D5Q455_9BACT|nr:DUF1349 domain-containing protein [candidate division KSB3 bacterium]MBD3323369.1 DUF1349 domain-containing protein [candidate division KSB3 bacterium]